MDVMNVEQAKIAEEAGASAVMALGLYHLHPALHHVLHTDDTIGREDPRKYPSRWWSSPNGQPFPLTSSILSDLLVPRL